MTTFEDGNLDYSNLYILEMVVSDKLTPKPALFFPFYRNFRFKKNQQSCHYCHMSACFVPSKKAAFK